MRAKPLFGHRGCHAVVAQASYTIYQDTLTELAPSPSPSAPTEAWLALLGGSATRDARRTPCRSTS